MHPLFPSRIVYNPSGGGQLNRTAHLIYRLVDDEGLGLGTLVLFVGLLAAWPAGWLSDLPGDVPAWAPALAVLVAGFAFGLLWPLAVVGVLLIAGPTMLVWAVLVVVWLLDLAKAVWNKVRGRTFERPSLLPPREPILS